MNLGPLKILFQRHRECGFVGDLEKGCQNSKAMLCASGGGFGGYFIQLATLSLKLMLCKWQNLELWHQSLAPNSGRHTYTASFFLWLSYLGELWQRRTKYTFNSFSAITFFAGSFHEFHRFYKLHPAVQFCILEVNKVQPQWNKVPFNMSVLLSVKRHLDHLSRAWDDWFIRST